MNETTCFQLASSCTSSPVLLWLNFSQTQHCFSGMCLLQTDLSHDPGEPAQRQTTTPSVFQEWGNIDMMSHTEKMLTKSDGIHHLSSERGDSESVSFQRRSITNSIVQMSRRHLFYKCLFLHTKDELTFNIKHAGWFQLCSHCSTMWLIRFLVSLTQLYSDCGAESDLMLF